MPNKALLPDKFSALLQIFRRARRSSATPCRSDHAPSEEHQYG